MAEIVNLSSLASSYYRQFEIEPGSEMSLGPSH